jgi:hypothetical protein
LSDVEEQSITFLVRAYVTEVGTVIQERPEECYGHTWRGGTQKNGLEHLGRSWGSHDGRREVAGAKLECEKTGIVKDQKCRIGK